MTRVFVDTSAILALRVPTDMAHERAVRAFRGLAVREAALLTSSYVLVETYALLGRRLGTDAATAFRDQLAPLLQVVWIDSDVHERGLDRWIEHGSNRLSLVDATSFVVAEEQGIDEVFAFDRHFEQAGFRLAE